MRPVDYDLVADGYERRYETNQFDGIDDCLRYFLRGAAGGAVAEIGMLDRHRAEYGFYDLRSGPGTGRNGFGTENRKSEVLVYRCSVHVPVRARSRPVSPGVSSLLEAAVARVPSARQALTRVLSSSR